MRLQSATILNAVLLMEHVHAVSTLTSYEDVRDVQKLPSFTVDSLHEAKRFLRALGGVDEARTVNLARQSSELKEALANGFDPVMSVVNNVNILKNLAPDLSIEAQASEVPFPVGKRDKVHKALLLLSGNANYLDGVTDKAQPLQNYLKLLETEPDHSAPAVVDAMKAIRSEWDKYKKLLDRLDFKKQRNLLSDWLGEKSSKADMLKLLTSDVKEEDLYNGKLLAAFDTYVNIHNTKHPTERLSLLAALTVCFGDFRVAQMIDTAKAIPASKESAKLAKDLEKRQIKYWVDARKTPDEVARLLRIGSPLLDASDMAMIGRWLKFIKKLSKHEKATSLYPIETLKSIYSHSSSNFDYRMIKFLTSESDLEEGPAELLKASLMRYWFNSLKTPDQLVKLFESKPVKSFDGKSNNYASFLKRYKKFFDKIAPPSQSSISSGLEPASVVRDEKWYNLAFAELNTIVSKHNENQPIEKLSLLAALTLRYGDRDASTIIDEGMRVKETTNLAKLLEAEQIQSWVNAGKTPDEVSKLLDFKSRSLGYKWITFCNSFSLRHPELAFDPFEKLRYRFSDDVLATFVVMARSEKLDNAKQFEDMLLRRWFQDMKTPEELEVQLNRNEKKKRFFVSLLKTYSDFHMNLGSSSSSKINTARTKINVLTSSTENTNLYDGRVLGAVKAYVQAYNEVNPNKPLSLLAALTARLGYKDASTVIEAAKALPDLVKTAKQLEMEQIQFWVDSEKTSDQVFKLLDFESKSPASVYKWIKFYDRSVVRDPKLAFDPFKSLRNHFSDDELALFVVEATPVNLVSAIRLENLLVWRWFEEMKTPEELKALLNRNKKKHLFVSLIKKYSEFYKNLGPPSTAKINRPGHSTGNITPDMLHGLTSTDAKMNLYDGSVLVAIDAYVRLYNKANTREPLSLLAALTARLGHRDASTVIEAAKAVPNLAKIAKQLETEQMQFWVDAGMTPNQVVELLDPKSQGLAMIYRYIHFMNVYSKRPSESLFDPLKPLKKYFSEIKLAIFAVEGAGKESDDAKQLQAMLLRSWFNNMMPFKDVAKLLRSNGIKLTTFENLLAPYRKYLRWEGRPSKQGMVTSLLVKSDINNGRAFAVYKANIDEYNKENPLDQLSLVAVLTARFGDKEAAHVIEAATRSLENKDFAEKIQRTQMELWLNQKKKPLDVLVWIVSVKNNVLQPELLTWLKFVDVFKEANPSATVPLYSMLIKRFGMKIVDKAVFATNLDPKWNNVAERLCTDMEQWWRNTEQHPDNIHDEVKDFFKDAKVLTNRKFRAYVKYVFDYSNHYDLLYYRLRLPVLEELQRFHTKRYLTIMLNNKKAKKMVWKVKSGETIDPLDIMKLGLTQVDVDLYDAWMSYISTILDPSREDYVGYNAITLMTSTALMSNVFEHLKLAIRDETLKDNAKVLLHEIFDEWAFDKALLNRAYRIFMKMETNDPIKTLVNALVDYRKDVLHENIDEIIASMAEISAETPS